MLTTFHTYSLSVSSYFGILGSLTPRRASTSFHGKTGLKAQRCCSWKKLKANNILLDAHPKVMRAMKHYSIKFKDLITYN
jgi:hypothetical protein